jgi:hypothetical protein
MDLVTIEVENTDLHAVTSELLQLLNFCHRDF